MELWEKNEWTRLDFLKNSNALCSDVSPTHSLHHQPPPPNAAQQRLTAAEAAAKQRLTAAAVAQVRASRRRTTTHGTRFCGFAYYYYYYYYYYVERGDSTRLSMVWMCSGCSGSWCQALWLCMSVIAYVFQIIFSMKIYFVWIYLLLFIVGVTLIDKNFSCRSI